MVNPTLGSNAYFPKNTRNLNLGILKLGAKNLNKIWSVNSTAKNVPKKALAYLLAVCKVIMCVSCSS